MSEKPGPEMSQYASMENVEVIGGQYFQEKPSQKGDVEEIEKLNNIIAQERLAKKEHAFGEMPRPREEN
jgi:hypothetical protein